MKDLSAEVLAFSGLAPAATTGTRTQAAGLDLSKGESFLALVNVGAVTTINDTDKLTLSILTGNESDGTGAVAIDSDAYLQAKNESNADWNKVLDASSATANKIYKAGFVNKAGHLYAFAKLTHAGSPSAIVGVTMLVGALKSKP